MTRPARLAARLDGTTAIEFLSNPERFRTAGDRLRASPSDAVGYMHAALTAPPSTRFTTVYAVSADTRRFWEPPDPAILAYTPADDAELHAADIPGADLPADPDAPWAGLYARPAFTLRHLKA